MSPERDFNPRAPCGARQGMNPIVNSDNFISTHAPLAGRDQLAGGRERDSAGFQPTRPLRGATVLPLPRPVGGEISTHAPLAGRDCLPVSATTAGELDFNPRAPCGARRHRGRRPSHQEHFNPRAPCGARPRPLRTAAKTKYFNPRAPCGARRGGVQQSADHKSISTHAPLAGRDEAFNTGAKSIEQFQPTRPLRGATVFHIVLSAICLFQPTRPLRGATHPSGCYGQQPHISTHAPLAGRDADTVTRAKSRCEISTHAPLAGRDSKSVQITMHIFAITDKFQMLLHRMLPVRAFCSFLMQENHADFGCEPPK